MGKRGAGERSLFDDVSGGAPDAPAQSRVLFDGVVVRETLCKSILNDSRLGGYSLNCYTGCSHACAYCYARFMQRFHPHPETWGEFVDVKANAVEALRRQLRRAAPGKVFVSSACDGWQHLEAESGLTRECCQLLLEHGFTVSCLTKSALILRDLDVLSKGDARVGVSLTTLDERLRELWEPGAGTVADRLRVLTEAHEAGIPTTAMCGPLLPYLSDGQDSIEAMFAELAERDVSRVWVDPLNRRPRVWEAVQELLREHFPDLLADYRGLLFEAPAREAYVRALRARVRMAAERTGLGDRVVGCG